MHPELRGKFLEAVNDDLNLPRAMAVVQEMLKSELPAAEKHATILDFDRVLGLDLDQVERAEELPAVRPGIWPPPASRPAPSARTGPSPTGCATRSRRFGYAVKDTRDGMQLLKP